ncbi:FUSC family protein [Francisella frigiditurris]|uniref:Fusaric acid resistance-like family protein n=1 Tax=Francisella frigiditurris TaxID=1542390 RepID=A0A1J0KWA8_9GAMM|nr:FUSC family protein [Francisella frigiditurris]APC97947.1 fusaric acid resistance -like family protein [Francisella frigiditurris]
MIFSKDRLIDKMSDNTLLAFRALLASTIGLLICYIVFSLSGEDSFRERIYWVVFAVVSVTVSTNTDVVFSRAKNIAVFSVLGCTLGSVILMLIQKYMDSFILIAILCSLSLMLYTYTMFLNYATSVFFIHIYLVMFFGLFVFWDTDLFFVRIICVFIGTISILAVFIITKSTKNRVKFQKEMYILYGEFKQIVDSIDRKVSNKKIINLVQKNISLNEQLLAAKYEFNTRREYYSYKQIILLMDELLINLKTYRVLFIQEKKHKTELYKEFVDYTNEAIKKNFKKLTIRYDRILLGDKKNNLFLKK